MERRNLALLATAAVAATNVAGCSLGPAPTPSPSACVSHLRAEYVALATSEHPINAETMATTRTIIEYRLNSTGTAAVTVQVEGADRVLVLLPAPADQAWIAQLRRLIAQKGRLEFVPVPAGRTDVEPGKPIPAALLIDPGPLFRGDQLSKAFVTVDQSDLPAVGFELKAEGAQLFSNYTATHVGGQFAIVLDGIVQSAPNIASPIRNGRGVIAGSLTQADANGLVAILKYGELPVDIEEVAFGPGPTCAV